ncbi:uncharacterized protein F4822DRAFT_429114 [Hypoxylon trugodes]|uniref:uncharacterized protein n=1 Tax=Hypoxylon trugodes TaxID=326681 RepID=UPI0021A1ECB4|nr:uncharacterized protein F4822DRAFT_429114 [Hypoxylon trugodes]KAI1388495.1 hypothetical protein F4822DRAFT_429114 [Hypoxylon trugodes]
MDPGKHNLAGSQSLMSFVARYKQYEDSRDDIEELLKDLIKHIDITESQFFQENGRLLKALYDTRRDLECSQTTTKELNNRLDEMESHLGYTPARNPYVMVLVDGDNVIFKEQLINQGAEGGKKAVQELCQSVLERFAPDKEAETEIFVKVVASVPGLIKALKRDGCVKSETLLSAFMTGFNQAKATCDFVDIGYSKEGVMAQIFECARFHLRNFDCKQVILGLSHDAACTPTLRKLAQDDDVKPRITVLEGCPKAVEIEDTGISVITFEKIFRSTKLGGHSCKESSSLDGYSYAAKAKAGASPPPKITLPIPLKEKGPPKKDVPKATSPQKELQGLPAPEEKATPKWTLAPRGLDPPIHPEPAALERVRIRHTETKLCNNHYLRGPCETPRCPFEHGYKPTKSEKEVILYFCRLKPCVRGQLCEEEDCPYGHNCPAVVKGTCISRVCRFRQGDHPPGTKFSGPMRK